MKSFVRWALALSFFLSMSGAAFSQSRNTGEIRGTVSAAGAVVQGATVTLTNIDTGETKDFLTNQDGIYDTVSTPAGNYNISFTSKGFKKLVRGPIALQVDVITENASLEVGAITETITVEAGGAPLLETETAHLGAILEAKTIGELPQIGAGITGNDWANFNILLPGAAGSFSQPASEGSGSYNAGDAIALNGNLPNYANYLQDGAVVQLPVSNNVDNTVFPAVQEVQITTSSFSAEYGIGGAVFNQITKSGTNAFHGSGYEFFQYNGLNANPYFGLPNSSGAVTPQIAPSYHFDEYGGSVGGPIIKNKLFFFFVVDKIYNLGAASATLGTTPTLAERGMGPLGAGILDFSAAGLPTLYDPATTTSNATTCASYGVTISATQPSCRESFAQENTGALAGINAIPAGRIDPVAANVLGFYPAPNAGAPGAVTNNYSTVLPLPNPNLRFFGRIDYDFSAKNRMSFSISQKNNPGVNKYGPFPCPINCFSGDIDGYNAQFTDTWEISPKMVNEFRMGYTKQGNWFVPQTLGFNSATTLGLQYAKANVFPTINITGNGQCCSGLAPGTNAIYIEGLYDPSDVMTLIRGKHILHFGVEVLMGDGDTTPWGNITAGNFAFTGQYTQQNGALAPGTGAGLADFLLGDVENWGATNQGTSYMRLKSPQLFVQDDYKVRPNLTVNLGLRYVATTGMSELHNSLGGFDPNLVNAYDGSLGSMWFAGQDNRTTLQKPIYDIFLPRVGFAWSIRNDTVIRGGFGMYSYNYSQDDYGNGIGAGSLTTSTGTTVDPAAGTGASPLIAFSASAATAGSVLTYVVGSPNANQPRTYCCTPGVYPSETYVPYNVPVGRINQWQLSAEHQFAGNYMASIAYVGSHAMNLQFPTDINQITNTSALAVVAANPTAAVIQANRPFSDWGGLGGNNYNAISNYNSFQATINKHYSNGLLFSFNYVWSHFLDEQDSAGWGSRGGTQAWQIGNDPKANYANSNFDIPNAFKGYVAYDLPFGKGKPYLNSSLADYAVGGWRLAGTVIAQSGVPFTVTFNGNDSLSQCGNGCSWFPNLVGNPHASPGALPSGAPVDSVSWFNTSAYAEATPGTFGTDGRNTLFGPRLTVVNMSLAKSFSVGERVHVELRSDWVNALNHPSFGNPASTLGASNFGLINNSTTNGGIAVAPRSGQLSAKITF